MYYIYLNHYKNGYLYVGSHTWKGEGIDPNYFGSSHVAENYGWKPESIEILQVVNDPKKALMIEGCFINQFAEKYGIADCVYVITGGNKWINKFKNHGLLINAQANTCEHLWDKENYEKAWNTRKLNKRWYKEWVKKSVENLHTDTANESRSKTLKEWLKTKEGKEIHKRALEAAITSDARVKAVRKYQKFLKTEEGKKLIEKRCLLANTKEARKKQGLSRRKNCKDKYQLSDGFIGTSGEIAEHTGIPSSTASAWCHGNIKTPKVLRGKLEIIKRV